MKYQPLEAEPIDYLMCRYGASKVLFRGPKRSLRDEYVTFLGGTETFGRFLERPYPNRVEDKCGVACVNLGCVNSGIDVFVNDPALIDICKQAKATIIQVPGAANMSNRFYTVHPRRNDRFVAASSLMRTIFRGSDFTDTHFTRHLLENLLRSAPSRFDVLREELQQAWLARMKLLMRRIGGKVILLWMSDHAPPSADAQGGEVGLDADPLFVTREMLDEVAEKAHQVIELVPSQTDLEEGRTGLIYNEPDRSAADKLLGTTAHDRAAEAVSGAITSDAFAR